MDIYYISIYIYVYLEPVCPIFWGFNPPKQGLFQSKQGSFGFQVYVYIYTYVYIQSNKMKVHLTPGAEKQQVT